MPRYTYLCECGYETVLEEGMIAHQAHPCPECDGEMWRKPSAPMVNWNGLRPSKGELHPHLREVVRGAERRRNEYAALKENYERERSADSD